MASGIYLDPHAENLSLQLGFAADSTKQSQALDLLGQAFGTAERLLGIFAELVVRQGQQNDLVKSRSGISFKEQAKLHIYDAVATQAMHDIVHGDEGIELQSLSIYSLGFKDTIVLCGTFGPAQGTYGLFSILGLYGN